MTVTEESAHQGTLAEIALGLRRWYRGESDRRTANRLTAVAVEIVLQSYGLRRRIFAAAAAGGTTPAQIALSLLAELFIGAGSESRLGFSLRDVTETDDAAMYSKFRQVVRTVAQQKLFHRWPENDPLSARLWRRLHRVIRDDDRIMSFPSDRPEWIAGASIETSADLDLLDESTLRRIVSAVLRPDQSMADLVAAVIAHPDGRGKAIAVDALYGALRQCVPQGMAMVMEEEKSPVPHNPDYALAVEDAVSAVREEISFVLDRYIAAGKLSTELAQGFRQALRDLASDWGEGEPAVSLYEYLHAHLPEVTVETYRRSYRAVFEYLAEQVRERFFDQMRQYYSDKKSAGPSRGH